MNWKKKLRTALAAGLAASAFAMPPAFAAEGEESAIAAEMPDGARQEMDLEELLQSYMDTGYKYTSPRYGYSIVCPVKPSVVPLSVLFDDEAEKGDVLVFKSEGMDISYGWIVMIDAFDEETIPADIMTQPEEAQKAFVERFMENAPYSLVRLTEVDGRAGVYAITAKEIDIDTDGDGQMDDVMTAESQMVKTFFRGQYGGRFGVMLMDNPTITQQGEAYYQLGVLTFQEWPTALDGDKGKKDGKDKKAKGAEKKKADK